MEIVLIRHGQSESNARLTSELDARLTELGERQAEVTAEYLIGSAILPDPAQVELFVSPFLRTLQTCLPLARAAGLEAHAYPDMCEYFSHHNDAFRSFVGLTEEQIRRDFPYVLFDTTSPCQGSWWPHAPEDVPGIYRRVERVRDMLIERYFGSGRQVVIYSHAEPIGRLVEALLHVEPTEGWPPWNENCGISRLVLGARDKSADLVLMNDTSHLQERGLQSPTFPGFNAPPEATATANAFSPP